MTMTTPTDLYCVIGNPVAHSRSPWIHSRFAELTQQTLDYDRREVALDGFEAGVRAFIDAGGLGCSITVPFKMQAAKLADHASERCLLAQAANLLTFQNGHIVADNTDGIGLVNDIERHAGLALQGLRLLLIGAGGAASGVLGPLINARPAHIGVTNRTLTKASALVAHHQSLAMLQNVELTTLDLQGLEGSFDVVINATACSLHGAGVPVDARVLKSGALAYDMMYGAHAQGFLDWAQHHGAVARDGLGMLVEQAAEAFLVWRGVRPPSAQVLAELRSILGSK